MLTLEAGTLERSWGLLCSGVSIDLCCTGRELRAWGVRGLVLGSDPWSALSHGSPSSMLSNKGLSGWQDSGLDCLSP